jgi:GNAT superfamily N-acetyltransferase
MEVVQPAHASEFLQLAAPLLLADEARHNLILSLGATLRDWPGLYPEQRLWLVSDEGRIVGAALRTPPHRLVLARPGAVGTLEALAAGIDELPGVVGAVPEANEFAAAWVRRTGAGIEQGMAQGVYKLERVLPPQRPASGAPRRATEGDRELLREWVTKFSDEALGELSPALHRLDPVLDQRLGPDPTSGFLLWEDEDRPVSLTGFSGPTPNGIRISHVYTPPALRGRGYASALVAHVSQAQLDAGRRFCFLYTDLANPTSNKIYVAVGYERICESMELDFR